MTGDKLYQFLTSFYGHQTSWTTISGTAQEYTRVVGQAMANAVKSRCMAIPPPG